MHRNAPNKALMFWMAASLLDVFARNEPICRELRLPRKHMHRPLFWYYLCNLHFPAHQQHRLARNPVLSLDLPDIHATLHRLVLKHRTPECWNAGTLERWNAGMLERRNAGTPEY